MMPGVPEKCEGAKLPFVTRPLIKDDSRVWRYRGENAVLPQKFY